MELRCRICRKPVKSGEKYFPFCSERCKLIDLGAWADERYRITRSLKPDDDPEAVGEGPPEPDGEGRE
jgi:uncharacterized protein